jgi:hypothetical protein
MAGLKVLVPYDFKPYEEKSLDLLVNAFGNQKDIKITLFNAYAPLPEVDMDASPELEKMRAPIISLSEELRRKEDGLVSAKNHLIENGFEEDQVDYVFKQREKDLVQEIAETLLHGHYRVVVLTRRPAKVTRLFSRSVHSRLLSVVKDVIVCIAT